MTRTTRTACCVLVSLASTACLFPFDRDDDELTPIDERACSNDYDCGSSSACREVRCVVGQCEVTNVPAGVPTEERQLQCQKLVCDGAGGTLVQADPTALPDLEAPACRRYTCMADGNLTLEIDPSNTPTSSRTPCQRVTCDAAGNPGMVPDPSNEPSDTPNDCKIDRCDTEGNVVKEANPNDLPKEIAGDCMRQQCDEEGGTISVIDDTDTPAPSTCFSYACENGRRVSTPINPTSTCSSYGFVCGDNGACGTCPVPDAACTNPGPGSRSQSSAHDFGGIGRTDSGGRSFCGAVPSGAAEYYTYHDNQTGFLAVFDPYYEIRPQTDARMCVYFDCPTITCPANTTSDTLSGHSGCCWDAQAGSFTGRKISFCSGGRVTIKVTTQSACAGYQLRFHD